MTAKLTKGGAKDRVRLGAGARTPILLPGVTSLTVAEDRFSRLRQMVTALVDSKKQSEAPRIIADAARVANNPKAFAGIERAVRDLCTREGALDKPMTMNELCHLYTSGELQRRYPRHVDVKGKTDETRELERRRLALLCKVIGNIPVADLTRDDCERAMLEVPATASSGWRRSHSQPLFHVLDIACLNMRLIEASPLPRRWADAPNAPAMTAILYPKEEAQLAACPDVDIDFRVMWGVQIREGLRPGGVALLRRDEVDLDSGTITHRHKTKSYRMWTLGADVVRVLRWWLDYRPDPEFVFPHVARGHLVKLAAWFREALVTAGVNRRALHAEATAGKRPIRAHDLRTSFVTVAFADGRPESWISARTGHTTAAQLARYKRVAESLEALDLGWFAPLDEVLGVGSGVGPICKSTGENPMSKTPACSLKGTEKRSRAAKSSLKPPSGVLSAPENRAQGGGGGLCGPAPEATVTALDEDSLTDLLALATKAKRWDLVAKVGAQLEDIERVRAATGSPKVASLDAARAKRERTK